MVFWIEYGGYVGFIFTENHIQSKILVSELLNIGWKWDLSGYILKCCFEILKSLIRLICSKSLNMFKMLWAENGKKLESYT